MMLERLAIGVDLGGTKIASALVTSRGEVLATRQMATDPNEGSQAVLARIAEEVNALVAAAPGTLLGVGIGSPGQVIADQGLVRWAVNLGWQEVDLVQGVRSQLDRDLPIWIQKDANAAVLGEYYFGAAQGCRDLVYLSVGTGLGCGILANQELVTGANWIATDIGHLSMDPNGRSCACGLHGCIETVVSGPGVIYLANQYLADHRYPTELESGKEFNVATILDAAHRGDSLAQAVFSQAGSWLGAAMSICVAITNPAMIVIGGGLGLAAYDLLIPTARIELERRVTPLTLAGLHIAPSCLTSSAAGAACLVWYSNSFK